MLTDAADWLGAVAEPDGGVTTVLPSAVGHPRAPWMEPSTGSGFLTYALAGKLWQAGSATPWLEPATRWCWDQLEGDEEAGGYTVKFAIDFLDAVPTRPAPPPLSNDCEPRSIRTAASWSQGAPRTRCSPRWTSLFTETQIEADLDRLEAGQREDGGWTVEYLPWSPAQALEWRGLATISALGVLRANGRL